MIATRNEALNTLTNSELAHASILHMESKKDFSAMSDAEFDNYLYSCDCKAELTHRMREEGKSLEWTVEYLLKV